MRMKLNRVNLLIGVILLSTLVLSAHRVLDAARLPLDKAYIEHTPRQYPPRIPRCDKPLWERIKDRCNDD